MQHILLPTDFSGASFNAATFALQLYGNQEAEYTLLNVYLKLAYSNALYPPVINTERESRNALRRAGRRFRKQAGKVRLSLRSTFSPLAQAINKVDAAKPVDMVVMGTQGEGNYGLVGRNTGRAVTSATLPVIAVPAQWKPVVLNRILFADDGLDDSTESLRPLLWIAKSTGAHITVLHVGVGAGAQQKRLGAILGGIPHAFATVEPGEVVAALERIVAAEGIDLVAVVRRQRSFWHRLFQGSTSKHMALHTTVPLLVLRS